MTYEEAVQRLEGTEYENDIVELSKARLFLGGHYARINGDLANILEIKPAAWMKIRLNTKSDTAAEREWESMDLGKDEMKIRRKLKSIEIMQSALNSRISVLQGENKNIF